MTVTWPPVAAQHTATMPVGRYPGFRRLFAPGELTFGLIMPLEHTQIHRPRRCSADVPTPT